MLKIKRDYIHERNRPLSQFIVTVLLLSTTFILTILKTAPFMGMQMVILAYISVGVLSWFFGRKMGLISALIFYYLTGLLGKIAEVPVAAFQIIVGGISFISISFISGYVSRLYFELKETQEQLAQEHRKNELLLENILPSSIAKRLKEGEKLIADRYSESTILFFDLVGFTKLASERSPEHVVDILNEIICSFDAIVDTLHLEKIKTIGDAYLVVSGLPERRRDHAHAIADMALAMKKSLAENNERLGLNLQMRIGIHSGPVVGGVIGKKKFTFDLWGDTVNIASRMESHGIPNEIQVSEHTYHFLKNDFILEHRGDVEIKNRGSIGTWILKGRSIAQ